jgi:hypothetical protein
MQQGQRQVYWLIAPMPGCSLVTGDILAQAGAEIDRVFGASNLIVSGESGASLLGVLAAERRSLSAFALVTAGLEDQVPRWPAGLWPLDRPASAILDLKTGKLWTYLRAYEQEQEPVLMPTMAALLSPGLHGRPLATRDVLAPARQDAIYEALLEARAPHEANVPVRLQEALKEREEKIAERAASLQGQHDSSPDEQARDKLVHLLVEPSSVAATTAYVTHDIRWKNGTPELGMVAVSVGGRVHQGVPVLATVEPLLKQFARECRRWVVPRALDLLAWMNERGLELPESVIDPGLVAFALNPDQPLSLLSFCALPISAAAVAWMGDLRRGCPPPADLFELVPLLPELDRNLAQEARLQDMDSMIERDLGPTLPVLARIEVRGAWVGVPRGGAGWEELFEQIQGHLDSLEARLRLWLTDDPYGDVLDFAAQRLVCVVGALPLAFEAPELTPEQRIKRFHSLGVQQASDLLEARSIVRGLFPWFVHLRQGRTRLRGRSAPQRTGRWGFRDLAMQNLPRRSRWSTSFRDGLYGPPGHTLIGADINAFEPRLLAGFSQDPALLLAAQQPDLHAANTSLLEPFLPREMPPALRRDLVKLATLAFLYGQSKASFARQQSILPTAEAERLYDGMKRVFRGAVMFRREVHRRFEETGEVATLGGWRRYPENQREAFNALLQGQGAEIQRGALRILDRELRFLGAFVVHHAHDQVLVAVPEGLEAKARKVVEYSMTQAVAAAGLVPRGSHLQLKCAQGTTWGDVT